MLRVFSLSLVTFTSTVYITTSWLFSRSFSVSFKWYVVIYNVIFSSAFCPSSKLIRFVFVIPFSPSSCQPFSTFSSFSYYILSFCCCSSYVSSIRCSITDWFVLVCICLVFHFTLLIPIYGRYVFYWKSDFWHKKMSLAGFAPLDSLFLPEHFKWLSEASSLSQIMRYVSD